MDVKEQDSVDWDGYYGRCPTCHEPGSILDVGRVHFGVCEEHSVYWPVGENLFSGWQDQTPAEREANATLIRAFRRVVPYYLPSKAAAVVNAARQTEYGGDFDDEPPL